MEKKRVYVETSVISDLTAWPASQPLHRHRQLVTAEWWAHRWRWECILTRTVIAEIRRGDPAAAALRLETARNLVELPITTEVNALADLLLARKLVPPTAVTDAFHLAGAAFTRSDYLLTWNQKHLDNFDLRSRIEDLIRGWGLTPAKVITPSRLLESAT